MKALFLILALVSASQCQKLQQYCKFTTNHTLCRTTGIGKACGSNIIYRGVPEKEAAVIVAQHNQFRAMIALGKEKRGAPGPQPKAADMMQMEWDEELAMLAQRHADQCIFEHECLDCRRVKRFYVGQNLFLTFDSERHTTVHWPKAVKDWYDEVKLYSGKEVSSLNFSAATGHFTQLVWHDTKYVGCGLIMYKEGTWYKKLYTCNYGSGGNVMSSPIYKIGDPCSACPAGTYCSFAYPGLCAPNKNSKGKTPNLSIDSSSGLTQKTNKNGKKQNLSTYESFQKFLQRFASDSQEIRTNSRDCLQTIVNSLPDDSQPLLFFRTKMGTLRQLNNMALTKKQTKGAMLLSCQDVTTPCPVVALSGNWTQDKEGGINVIRSMMEPSMGGQIVLGQTIPPPRKEGVCVTLSHLFKGTQQANLPEVHVGVWPLGQVLLQEEATALSIPEKDGWKMTKVSFAPIRNPFMVVLSVEPNPTPKAVDLALKGFMVTEGLCN